MTSQSSHVREGRGPTPHPPSPCLSFVSGPTTRRHSGTGVWVTERLPVTRPEGTVPRVSERSFRGRRL